MVAKFKNKSFLRNAEGVIASYDYTDIAEGTGIIKFYGGKYAVDATPANDQYRLNSNIILPSSTSTSLSTGTNEFDFDVTFNSSRIIGGTGYIQIPVYIQSTGTITPKVTIIHYDGTTETTLVAQITMVTLSGTASAFESVLKFTVPQTHFKKGETLRVNLVLESTTSSLPNSLNHNPLANQTSTYTNTGGALAVYTPFDLDL